MSPYAVRSGRHTGVGRTWDRTAYGVVMLIAFSVSPSGADDQGGVTDAVAEAVRIVRESGLPNRTDSMFTTIEGEWDECMAVVKACVDALTAHGPRVGLVLKADIRPGRTGELEGKLERLEATIAEQGKD